MVTRNTLLARSALIATGLAVTSIAVLDGPLATALSAVPEDTKQAINRGVGMCEWLFGFRISPYLYGLLLIVLSLTARVWRRLTLARILMFIGLAHVTARFVAGIMKPPFSRLRPYEALASLPWHDTWFAPVGNSFPSGHAVHFWSLFFPLAVLFPRFRWPLAILPVLVSLARVMVNHHYLGDVSASAAIAALVTWAYLRIIPESDLAASRLI